ncbi:unnamed protein product [Parnassius apollo]|uniref:(apollo) hypothetical protein n=1 Tax=Parnassius apollo TaxID=110799 RepID=A0A8S3YF33_PARAO|nr:unnamed protein product [Parnassius apollo]
MHNEFKECVASILESMDREHEDEIKELEDNLDALSDIIAGDISSEPDNVPRKKIELSRSLSFDSESDNKSCSTGRGQ